MKAEPESHFERLSALLDGVFTPPPGKKRIWFALSVGLVVHLTFAAGVLAMVTAMFFGMSRSLGTVPWPYAAGANALLILQFPLLHSFLLTKRGTRLLARLMPGSGGGTLATSTYAFIASLQLLALFALWTPTGIVWWAAEGIIFYGMVGLYTSTWLLLMKASFDAGVEVQSGALGWISLLKNVKPRFPDMPVTGLFQRIRHPIYVAFTLTLWTVPVWTPDQLALAVSFTAYCLLAPILKERRFAARYGDRFRTYQASVPYALPRFRK